MSNGLEALMDHQGRRRMTKAEDYHRALHAIHDIDTDSGPARAVWLSPAVIEIVELLHGIVNWCAHLEEQVEGLQAQLDTPDWKDRR